MGKLSVAAKIIEKKIGKRAAALAVKREGAAAKHLPILPGDYRVSTRFPEGPGAHEDPLRQHLSIGLEEMLAAPTLEHNADLLSNYPGFARLKRMSSEDATKAYVDQATENLDFLYRNAPDDMKERAPNWYEGANKIADIFAGRYGVPRRSMSAALAALSPQKAWPQNVSLAERVGDIVTGAPAGIKMTPAMSAYFKRTPTLNKEKYRDTYASIKGRSLDQLSDPTEQALWTRLYDEAHNPRNYRNVTPEGDLSGFVEGQNKTGDAAWGSLDEIAKAITALKSGGDMDVISPMLGRAHKVRNFYNAIELPNDPRFKDVVVDTHQVAGSQMRPLGGTTAAVSHNFGNYLPRADQPKGYVGPSSSGPLGIKGTYGVNVEPTRRLAEKYGIPTRAAQSSTWEATKGLFSDTFKKSSKAELVDNIWKEYDAGRLTIDEARSAILQLAGGIAEPFYAKPGLEVFDPRRTSTYRQ